MKRTATENRNMAFGNYIPNEFQLKTVEAEQKQVHFADYDYNRDCLQTGSKLTAEDLKTTDYQYWTG